MSMNNVRILLNTVYLILTIRIFILYCIQQLVGVETEESGDKDSVPGKLAFVSQENIASMVDQMIALRGKGYLRTSVNILKLLAVLCAPGMSI